MEEKNRRGAEVTTMIERIQAIRAIVSRMSPPDHKLDHLANAVITDLEIDGLSLTALRRMLAGFAEADFNAALEREHYGYRDSAEECLRRAEATIEIAEALK